MPPFLKNNQPSIVVTEIAPPIDHAIRQSSACSVFQELYFIFIMKCIPVNKVSVMFFAIWYHLYNFKNVKNIHEVVLFLLKLQAFSRQL